MNRFAKFLALAALAAIGAQAQPPKKDMQAITMPRASYNVTKDLKRAGDYGYYQFGSLRKMDNPGDPSKWYWARYTNSGNVREVYSYAALYPNSGNICDHGHVSYGLWGKYSYTVSGQVITAWVNLGMGTKSAVTVNGRCKWDVKNSWADFAGEDYGWGVNVVSVNIKTMPAAFKYTEFVVGGITVSHLYATCGQHQCGHEVYLVLYSL